MTITVTRIDNMRTVQSIAIRSHDVTTDTCPFRVSWWAVSFPLAASAIAALRVATAQPSWAMDAIALSLLGLASIVIGGLLVHTVIGIIRGELRVRSK